MHANEGGKSINIEDQQTCEIMSGSFFFSILVCLLARQLLEVLFFRSIF